jgi:hypothetical protein
MFADIFSDLLGVAGLLIVVYGVWGMARKQITTTGRPGRTRTYVGREAVAQGAFRIALGLVFVAGAWLSAIAKA